MYRVQMNSLEMLVAFLSALYLAANHWPQWLVAGLGAVYVLGRFLYWWAYVADLAKRGLGFMLSMLPTLLLLVLAVLGIVASLF